MQSVRRAQGTHRWAALLGGVLLAACGTADTVPEQPEGTTRQSLVSQWPRQAQWDATLKVPLCTEADWICEAGIGLVDKCGTSPSWTELNQPNTLDACADGSACGPTSINRLSVYTEDGSQLTQGRQVTVEAAVWGVSGIPIFVDFYFAPDAGQPVWTLISSTQLTNSSDNIKAHYTLPTGASVQAVRAAVRVEGVASPCTSGPYDERDDLAFTVAPPYVTGARVTHLAPGANHSLALREDGTLWGWGSTESGQLGRLLWGFYPIPSQVMVLSGVKAIASTEYTSFAVREDGTVWAWGHNTYGLLGDKGANNPTYVTTPVQVLGLSNVTALSVGGNFALALKSNGTVWAWGHNEYGQLGDGTTVNQTRPVRVAGLADVTAISAGPVHALALKSNGTVWSWGSNDFGQLGDGTFTARSLAARVLGIGAVTSIDAGGRYSLAMRGTRELWGWGYRAEGHLGDGTFDSLVEPRTTPGQSHVFAPGDHALLNGGPSTGIVVERTSGMVWTWGKNRSGEACQGQSYQVPSPTLVQGLTGVTNAAGSYNNNSTWSPFTLFSRVDGSVWGCGSNINQQLGVGNTGPWEYRAPVKSLMP